MFKRFMVSTLSFLQIAGAHAQTSSHPQFEAWNPLDPTQPQNIEFEKQQRYNQLFDSYAAKTMRGEGLQTQIQSTTSEKNVSTPMVIKKQIVTEKNFRELMHPQYQHPGSAAIFLLMRLPNRFRTGGEPVNGLTFTSTASNTMIHPTVLEGKNGGRRYQYVDHLGNVNELNLSVGDQVHQLQMSLRILDVAGKSKNNLVLYPVSDGFIEKFHESIGFDDPYARKRKGLDQVIVDLRDNEGNDMSLEDGGTYVLPLVLDYSQFRKIFESDKRLLTLNFGVQAQAPLADKFNQAGVGTYANLSFTKQMAREWLINFAIGLGTNLQKNIGGGYQSYDGKFDISVNANASVGLTRIDDDSKGRTSLLFFISQMNAYLDQEDYKENNRGRFVDRQSRYAMFRPDRRFGVAIVRENKEMILQVQATEDVIDSNNRMNGLNHEDFQVSIKITRKF